MVALWLELVTLFNNYITPYYRYRLGPPLLKLLVEHVPEHLAMTVKKQELFLLVWRKDTSLAMYNYFLGLFCKRRCSLDFLSEYLNRFLKTLLLFLKVLAFKVGFFVYEWSKHRKGFWDHCGFPV